MKLLIAGSRSIDKYRAFYEFIKWYYLGGNEPPREFVTGDCKLGADQVPHLLNVTINNESPIKSFPADWDKHGKKAGFLRNREMAEYADELLLIWDGESNGSRNMMQEMEKLGKPVHEIIIGNPKIETDEDY